jgi:regulator of protease activity HflC (stomatin/prohibitin superfamily)
LLGEGTHAKFPWDEIYIYSLRTQEISDKTVLLTRDGMELNVEWSVRFRPAPEFLPDIHRRVGPEYAKRLILPEVTGSLREIIGNHTAEEIYAGDENILIRDISRRTRTKLDPYHIVLDSLLILRLDLPPEMAKSIVEKLVNEQAMLAYRFRLRGEEEEKRRKEIEAQGIRTFEDISKVSILKWKGIEATRELARSNNAKIILMGAGTNSMPVLLNADTPAGGEASAPAAPAAPRAVK